MCVTRRNSCQTKQTLKCTLPVADRALWFRIASPEKVLTCRWNQIKRGKHERRLRAKHRSFRLRCIEKQLSIDNAVACQGHSVADAKSRIAKQEHQSTQTYGIQLTGVAVTRRENRSKFFASVRHRRTASYLGRLHLRSWIICYPPIVVREPKKTLKRFELLACSYIAIAPRLAKLT